MVRVKNIFRVENKLGSFLIDSIRAGSSSQPTDGKTKESCYNAGAGNLPLSLSLWLPRFIVGDVVAQARDCALPALIDNTSYDVV